jgi:hypothetical protein
MSWEIFASKEFWAAFWGAVTAFALEAMRRWWSERRHQAAAGNQAVFVLGQMYITLANLQKTFIDDRVELMRNAQGREPHYFEYQAMSFWWNPDTRLPMDRLGFLLKSYDPDLLNRMSTVEHSFFTILDTLAKRTAAHLEFTGVASETFGAQLPRPQELENAVGPDLSLRLRGLTESLLQHLPATIPLVSKIAGQVSETLGLVFPLSRFIGMEPTIQPFTAERQASAVPPKWRRLVRQAGRWRPLLYLVMAAVGALICIGAYEAISASAREREAAQQAEFEWSNFGAIEE